MSTSNTTGEWLRNTRVVSQRPLHPSQSPDLKGSHLSCARDPKTQCQRTVKLHRVFSSYRDSPGIFTGSAISPGLASRQYPHRDTIRAGRNFVVGSPWRLTRVSVRGRSALTFPLPGRWFFSGDNEFNRPLHRCRDRTISSPKAGAWRVVSEDPYLGSLNAPQFCTPTR